MLTQREKETGLRSFYQFMMQFLTLDNKNTRIENLFGIQDDDTSLEIICFELVESYSQPLPSKLGDILQKYLEVIGLVEKRTSEA
mgnify:CR=1 FL=1